jgi:hypothetical protein
MIMRKIGLGAGVFVVEDFLLKEECDSYISKSESMTYEDAAIQTKDGPRIYRDVRNNSRIIVDDIDLADFIFARAREFLPDIYCDEWKLVGLNERFRFYKYGPGEYFKWHKDGFYCRSDDEISQLTLMMYLNDGYVGGATEFKWDVIQPKCGMALVFPHLMMHQGSTIESGTKYVLRTDVMYKKMDNFGLA